MIYLIKRGRFDEEIEIHSNQIAFILRRTDEGTAVAEICRKAGVSEATFYNWRKRFGGMVPSEVHQLRQLEDENLHLKKIVADLTLDKAML